MGIRISTPIGAERFVRFLALGLCALFAVAPSLASAATSPKLIAVLEFEVEERTGLTDEEAMYITDLVREEALKLSSFTYKIMTRESITDMLPPGTNLAKCESEAQCEVEIGRNVGADLVVTGRVIKFDKDLKVTMKMHDTHTSKLIATDKASARNVGGLEKPVSEAAARIFGKLIGGEPEAASAPSYYDSLKGSPDTAGGKQPKSADDQRRYRSDLEKAWSAVKKAVLQATAERRLEMYQRFLSDFPVDNPYADKVRKEIDKLDAELAKKSQAEAKAAERAAKIEAEKARAAEIRQAYEAAKSAGGTASDKLAAWNAFVSAYPDRDNPYLSTAKREVASLQAEVKRAEAEARKKTTASAGVAGVEWIYSQPAGLQFTKSEITVSQYRACVNAGSCAAPDTGKNCNWDKGDRGNHPVNCIDWSQAKAACAWLGGRLPTEDEWYAEASNRGDRDWPWGDSPEVSCDYAVWSQGGPGCGRNSTWPVCSKPRGNSVTGLCDMSGNVWEWTATDYDASSKVVRGGSWRFGYPADLRASLRLWLVPAKRNTYGGVRCVRSSR